MDKQETIRQIRRKIFLARDGESASSLREKGIVYKTVLGVPIVTLRKIAANYPPDSSVADELWTNDHRELKILATMIQDPQSFAGSGQWVKDIQNLELAEQAVMNLFCKLENAKSLALDWIRSENLYTAICGFLLLTRLFSQNIPVDNEEAILYFNALDQALSSESILLKNAALASLKRLGRQSVLHSKEILARYSGTPFLDELKFDFDFYMA